MGKFEYDGGISAPNKYVMTIVAGNLNYIGGGGAVPLQSGSEIETGWGNSGGTMSVGDATKPLPNSLSIIFFSYLEDQFYRGDFELPYEKLLKLFQQGYYSNNDHKQVTYNEIVVGVAPGGAVAVWAEGFDKYTEVFFGQAEKIKGDWSMITRNPMPRKEYIYESLLDSLGTPEAVAAMQKKGPPVGLWSKYRTRYAWQPEFTNIKLRDGVIYGIRYFNGEFGDIKYPIESSEATQTRIVPKDMNFVWAKSEHDGRVIKLHFDETEIWSAFEKLGSQHQPLKLEIRADMVNGAPRFSVWLHNDKDKLELKHTKMEEFGAGPKM
jgi:hypothetical protein